MYDPLLREDPLVQEYMEQSRVEGKAEGEVKGMRTSISMLVQTRFPGLVELAMQRVEPLQDLAVLQQVLVALIAMPDERNARSYLQAL